MGADRGLEILNRLVRLRTDAGDIEIANSDAAGKLIAQLGASGVIQAFAGTTRFLNVSTALALRLETVTVNTTDATETAIWTRSVPTSSCVGALALVVAKRSGANADGLVATLWNAATNNAGTTAILNATDGGSVIENSAGSPTADFDINDTTDVLQLSVTGIAAENWTWKAFVLSFEAA